ncbi:hypothetical protein C5688_21140 [Methylocystis sp. MitZ-2018]|uniref:hypothetical protein n=1 Tax=Methylosinus sporium TaxID=428 RepID=UPI000D591B6E|nr:hypothetical protein [Methylosinus sporium]PWB88436.1 hypothetical protein C5688_21140 [Methylocystis sp. MitZ-2018]
MSAAGSAAFDAKKAIPPTAKESNTDVRIALTEADFDVTDIVRDMYSRDVDRTPAGFARWTRTADAE